MRVSDVFCLFFEMLAMDVCTTRHWQTFCRLVQELTLFPVPICQGFCHFPFFLHHIVLAKLATSSIRAKKGGEVYVEIVCIPGGGISNDRAVADADLGRAGLMMVERDR